MHLDTKLVQKFPMPGQLPRTGEMTMDCKFTSPNDEAWCQAGAAKIGSLDEIPLFPHFSHLNYSHKSLYQEAKTGGVVE